MPDELVTEGSLALASAVEGADLATREGRTVAVRSFLVGLLRGDVSPAAARAGAALLAVVVADSPAAKGDGTGNLLSDLLAVARRSRAELDAREIPAPVAAPPRGGWAALLEHPTPLEQLPQAEQRRANE